MTITIYNSKDKEQKKITKVTSKLAYKVLDRVAGKNGWWARAEEENGNFDILHFVNGEWVN